MRPGVTNAQIDDDPAVLALAALGWLLGDGARAGRLLAVTGLDPDALRGALDDPATLAAVLGFLEGHEPDLIACAGALDVAPAALVAARHTLETRTLETRTLDSAR